MGNHFHTNMKLFSYSMLVILYKCYGTNIVPHTLALERLQCTLSEKVLHYFEQLLPRTNLLHFAR